MAFEQRSEDRRRGRKRPAAARSRDRRLKAAEGGRKKDGAGAATMSSSSSSSGSRHGGGGGVGPAETANSGGRHGGGAAAAAATSAHARKPEPARGKRSKREKRRRSARKKKQKKRSESGDAERISPQQRPLPQQWPPSPPHLHQSDMARCRAGVGILPADRGRSQRPWFPHSVAAAGAPPAGGTGAMGVASVDDDDDADADDPILQQLRSIGASAATQKILLDEQFDLDSLCQSSRSDFTEINVDPADIAKLLAWIYKT